MKVYIYDDSPETTEKLCEAKRGSAFHLAKLYVDNFNQTARTCKAEIKQEEDGILYIYIQDRHPRPVGM